jgi:enoyl-CoA hydratase
MEYKVLELEEKDGVATLWLANEQRRNAMGPDFWSELPLAMREVSEDERVRAVVLAARGPHFTAGLDLKSMGGTLADDGGGSAEGGRTNRSEVSRRLRFLDEVKRLQGSITSVADCPKPVIAAVHGYCLGGGIDLITACDVRLASEEAIFSIRETRIAMVADVGTLQRLPGIVGKGIAAELALTGDDFGAGRALQIGLVNSVHANAAATLEAARAMADRMAKNSPLAVQGTKRVMRYCEGKSVEDGLDFVATWNAAFIQSEDLKEAMMAFMQKREAKFTGQ